MNMFSHWRRGAILPFLVVCALFVSNVTAEESTDSSIESAVFTGEILPVLYVRNVLASADFYVNKLGFVCDHYYDHINGGSVITWTETEPPLYAEMWAGKQRFALHRASNLDSLVVGGTRIYFGVQDVVAHRKAAVEKGVEAGEIIEQPWMHMYRVLDPDGHEIFIFTRPPGWDE